MENYLELIKCKVIIKLNTKKISPQSFLIAEDIEKTDIFSKFPQMDIILANNTFEHLKNPEKIIQQCSKKLSKKGYLVIRVPNLSCLQLKYYTLIGKKKNWICYKDPTHISIYTVKKWKKILENNGFKVKIIGFPPTIFLKKVMNKLNIYPTFKPFYLFNNSIVFQCQKI